jgi:CheY-like chemotaxis protein
MRVLIAEEDLITLTRLKRVLRGFGHEVEAVRDGLSAWKCLEKSPGADIAILNGLLPAKSGIEIAGELRSRNSAHYTYIILLAPNSQNCEVVAALEAGADGHLVLPVSTAELAAQLKAAERILKRENKLQLEIAGLREQLRSHNIPLSHPEPALEEAPAPAAVPDRPEPPDSKPAGEFGADDAPHPPEHAHSAIPEVGRAPATAQMEACFERILRRIRYVAPPATESAAEEPFDLTVYSAIVLEEQHLWLDLTMEMTRRVAVALYRALLSEVPHSDAEIRDAIEEVCNMCQGAWKTDLENAGLQPLAPGWPTARRSHEIPQTSPSQRLGSSSFTLPGPIRVTVLEQVARVVDKPLDAISPGDVLADSLSVPGQKLPLMKRGTALNARYIERIHDRLKPPEEENIKLRVIEPSSLALFMLRRWPRMSVDALLTLLVRSDGKEKQLRGRIHDISENGLGATIPDMLNPGQTVTLYFGLSGDEEFRIEAILRRRTGFRCGFEFLNVPLPSADRLKQAIKGMVTA